MANVGFGIAPKEDDEKMMPRYSKWMMRFLIVGVLLDLAISIFLGVVVNRVNNVSNVSNCWDSLLRYAVTHPATNKAAMHERTVYLTQRANICVKLGHY